MDAFTLVRTMIRMADMDAKMVSTTLSILILTVFYNVKFWQPNVPRWARWTNTSYKSSGPRRSIGRQMYSWNNSLWLPNGSIFMEFCVRLTIVIATIANDRPYASSFPVRPPFKATSTSCHNPRLYYYQRQALELDPEVLGTYERSLICGYH
jgi:hypothetical protein